MQICIANLCITCTLYASTICGLCTCTCGEGWSMRVLMLYTVQSRSNFAEPNQDKLTECDIELNELNTCVCGNIIF